MITRLFVWWFRLKGWKVGENIPPDLRKAVVIAAPHTSNWDFVYALATFRILGIRVNYLVKHQAYRFPFKRLLDNNGAIPVERSRTQNFVEQFIRMFHERESLYLLIPAEGTRSRVNKWKSGFYHTALGAGVPIMLGYLDFEKRIAGFGPVFHPTGDKDADMAVIREFYRHVKGRHPDKYNPESARID